MTVPVQSALFGIPSLRQTQIVGGRIRDIKCFFGSDHDLQGLFAICDRGLPYSKPTWPWKSPSSLSLKLENHRAKWKFIPRKITNKRSIFHCHVWDRHLEGLKQGMFTGFHEVDVGLKQAL